MEQFRQLGEVVGSLKALLVFQENIEINRRQCVLLSDLFEAAFDSVSEEMRNSLRFEEKGTLKWKILEQPLRDLGGIFRDGEAYVRHCIEPRESSFPAKAISLHRNRDCLELHIHNLLACVPVVREAIEAVGEVSGSDQEESMSRRRAYSGKYREEFRNRRVFRWKLGRDYLVSSEFCERFESVWREDWCDLVAKVRGNIKRKKNEHRLIYLLCKSFDPSEELFTATRLFPSSILLGSKDYQVRRRLGLGSQHKEILWMGESFAMRHVFGDSEPVFPEISSMLSISHPNIANALCGFADEERKEWFLITELMSKDLASHIKEICGPRKRTFPFSVPAAVDLMLQIARGMEYLHSKGIRHGDLNPSNILIKTRANGSYLQAKVSGFGLARVDSLAQKRSPAPNEKAPFIWHAPEVLEEQENPGSAASAMAAMEASEKSDVYSFGMVCFEVLTGKVPFEDGHLQGDKMSRNIRAGERPLFPFQAPKYLTSLTKKCWHADPAQRPAFSSLCRVLRYVKRFVSLNPDQDPLAAVPPLDYFDIESGLSRSFPGWSDQPSSVSQIPFQMFLYRASERESLNKENSEESGSDNAASVCGDEAMIVVDDVFPSPSESTNKKKLSSMKTSPATKPGTTRSKSVRPPQINQTLRSMRRNSESQLTLLSPRFRRTSSGHASDSELP